MAGELPYVVMVIGTALVGLWISNTLFDLKVPHYISRKIGHCAGGLAFLIAVMFFTSAWLAIALTAFFSLLLWLARLRRPLTFRGVGGSGRNTHAMSEVWFTATGIPVFTAGWLWLDQPLIALSAMLFMAWGDCITGLVRSDIYKKPVKGLWGSLAMFFVCLAISWAFVHPFWVGVLGSVAATVTEWSFGELGIIKWADDNWAVPVVSLAFMLGLMAATGSL